MNFQDESRRRRSLISPEATLEVVRLVGEIQEQLRTVRQKISSTPELRGSRAMSAANVLLGDVLLTIGRATGEAKEGEAKSVFAMFLRDLMDPNSPASRVFALLQRNSAHRECRPACPSCAALNAALTALVRGGVGYCESCSNVGGAFRAELPPELLAVVVPGVLP